MTNLQSPVEQPNDEFDELRSISLDRAYAEAYKNRHLIDLSIEKDNPICVTYEKTHLGANFEKILAQLYIKLSTKYGESLGKLISLTSRIYLNSIENECLFYKKAIEKQIFKNDGRAAIFATKDGYENEQGRVAILSNTLNQSSLIKELEDKYNHEDMRNDMFEMMGIYWLNEANELIKNNDHYDLDLICDGISAIHLSKNDYLWECGHEDSDLSKKIQKSQAAKKGHKNTGTYAIEEQVIEYYEKNKSSFPDDKIETAADIIYEARLANLARNTIRDYISNHINRKYKHY